MTKQILPKDAASVAHHPQTAPNSHSNGAAPDPAARILWLPLPNELALLRAVVNDFDAATRVLPTLEPDAFQTPMARRVFEACRDFWQFEDGHPLTPQNLASQCARRSCDTESGEESAAWCDCAEIALNDLATLPKTMHDPAKEAEAIARQMQKAPRFNLLSIPQLFERPDPEFLIEQWIVKGSTVLFTSKEESFKTFITLDLALCTATGKPWHGFRVTQPGTVIYVAAEGASGIKRRVQAWLFHHDETVAANRFFVLDMPLQMANDADRRAFIQQIKEFSPSLVVLDTLRRCAVGLEENSASDMGKVSDAMGEIARETGAACLVVHHNNKTGAYSGSTALPGNVDTHMSCERKDDIVTLSIEKQKDFEKHKPILFEAQTVTLPDTQGQSSSLVMSRLETRSEGNYALSEIAQRTFDALVEVFKDAHVSSSKWMRAADEQKGMAGSTFYKAQTELLAKGVVKMVSGEKNGRGKNAPLYAASSTWIPETSQVTPQLHRNSTEVVEPGTSQVTPQLHTPLGVGAMELESKREDEEEPIAPTLPVAPNGSVGAKPK